MKTRDTLKQHRKKLHNLMTPVPKTAEVENESASNPVTVVEEQIVGEEDVNAATFVEARGINTL